MLYDLLTWIYFVAKKQNAYLLVASQAIAGPNGFSTLENRTQN